MRYGVCLIHMADPRGSRIGGTETYVRDYIRHHPADMDLLYIGPDEIGDLTLGEVAEIECQGRALKYVPLYRVRDSRNIWAERIVETDTFVLAKALVRHWLLVRAILRRGRYSVELRRVEIAPLVRSFGVPFIQMLHIMQERGVARSGVLARHPLIAAATEFASAWLCRRFYLVNPEMTAAFRRRLRPFAGKFDTLTTWADPHVFRQTPFRPGPLKLLFAGRADAFKRLDIMLDVVRRVAAKRNGAVEFHYVGDGDLEQFPQFGAVRLLSVLHGRKNAAQLAEIQRDTHIGLLTSAAEGMPRFVLETLCAGRPVVALHLPQLEAVVKRGINGALVPRRGAAEDQADLMAAHVLAVHAQIEAGGLDPARIAQTVADYRPERLLRRIFNDHRMLHGLAPMPEEAR